MAKTKTDTDEGPARENLKTLTLKLPKKTFQEIETLGGMLGITAFTLGLTEQEAREALIAKAQVKAKQTP